jgi:hypothetical protein
MKKYFIFILLFFEFGCNPKEPGQVAGPPNPEPDTSIIDYNVVFAPDLSNRLDSGLYPKPLKDEDIVDTILRSVFPTIARYGRGQFQRDRYVIDFINKRQRTSYNVHSEDLKIDLGRFKNDQGARINYCLYKASAGLEKDRLAFIAEYHRICALAKTESHGADIWTYLNTGLDANLIDTSIVNTTDGETDYRKSFRNIIILFTDGYIEAGNSECPDPSNPRRCNYLSGERVEAFRRDFLHSGEKNYKDFFHEKGYGIIPVNNPLLKNAEILVLEMYDRSITNSGATKHPTDLEITQLFWSDWFMQSRVRHFDFQPCAANAGDAQKNVLDFMGIK